MAAPSIHKRGRYVYAYPGQVGDAVPYEDPKTSCGLSIFSMPDYEKRVAFRWESVTCSNCLKQHPEAKAASR